MVVRSCTVITRFCMVILAGENMPEAARSTPAAATVSTAERVTTSTAQQAVAVKKSMLVERRSPKRRTNRGESAAHMLSPRAKE